MNPDAQRAVAFALARDLARHRGEDWRSRLALYYTRPTWPCAEARLAQLLLDLRATGLDVLAAVRRANLEDAGVDVPVTIKED